MPGPINMSQISARQDSQSPLACRHWLSENIFDWANIGAVHIRPVEYVDIPGEAWGQILGDLAGMPPFLVTHLKAVAEDHKNGIFSAETDLVEHIGGQPPQSLAAFIRENRELFGIAQQESRA